MREKAVTKEEEARQCLEYYLKMHPEALKEKLDLYIMRYCRNILKAKYEERKV